MMIITQQIGDGSKKVEAHIFKNGMVTLELIIIETNENCTR